MPINVLFAARQERWQDYRGPLERAFVDLGLDVNLSTEIAPQDVDYIVYAPNSELQDFTPYTKARAVLNLWAGVENIVGNKTLHIPLARMVDPGLTKGMVEWVLGHTLRHHLGMDRDILNTDGTWVPRTPPLAHERNITVLGLGALGQAVALALHSLGFSVTGWLRGAKDVDGIRCLHGSEGLARALSDAQIVITLLPDTPATRNTLNAETIALLPRGAFIINPGRGTLIDDDALLAALDSGHVAHATLDVFRVEPLPQAHPFWAHPNVTVTPHIAAETRATTASQVIAENVRRGTAGENFLHLVDRISGY